MGKDAALNGFSACCGRVEAGNGKLTYFIGRHRGEKLNKLHRVTSVCMQWAQGSEAILQLQGRDVRIQICQTKSKDRLRVPTL